MVKGLVGPWIPTPACLVGSSALSSGSFDTFTWMNLLHVYITANMASNRSDFQCKLYVGDLAKETTEKDLERAFSYYGGLRSVWVARNPAGFGFVVYEDKRDAEDAIDGLNGT